DTDDNIGLMDINTCTRLIENLHDNSLLLKIRELIYRIVVVFLYSCLSHILGCSSVEWVSFSRDD
ncbi:hypothetical protein KFP14_10010, partial [Streptococcus suis]|uniref:hypothetical protein n=1 Tax=Streptococcus suis TaxID=1307 RepID=UPI001BA6EF8C